MTSRSTRHRLPLLLRSFVLFVALVAAPVGLAAESPEPSSPAPATLRPEPPRPTTPPPATLTPDAPAPVPPAPLPPVPGGSQRTSVVIDDDLERAKAEQELLAAKLAEQARQVAQLETLQNELEGEIDQTAIALEAVTADLSAVRTQITLMTDEIEKVKATYATLVAELQTLDVQLADLVVREEDKRLDLVERQALLSERLREANDADRTSMMEMFLSGGTFSDVLAEVAYHLDIGNQDKVLADRIKRDQETLATLHTTIETTRTQTNLVRQETAVQKKELDAELLQLESTKALLAALEAQTARDLALQQQAFEELAESQADLEAAIARAQVLQRDRALAISILVEEQARLGHIPSEYNGTLVWPLVARVSGEWGCSLYTGYGPGGPGCDHYHNGIDIVDECGAEITAAGDGIVAYVGWNWADGPDPAWIVVMAHSAGMKTWYAHMTPVAPPGIVMGAQVKAGDVIGMEGTTGNSTGCHLHWMVEFNGQFVNPREFL
jgi:murein DD-endopeptidase MepM/ murein hydrolase activator NlpD